MNSSPNDIRTLEPYQIFVFGSNLLGQHGAGAARLAVDNGWAEWGKGYGLHMKKYNIVGSFAIPTKGVQIETLSLKHIKYYVEDFCRIVPTKPYLQFLITEIGCGLAGYKPVEIAPMFQSIAELENVFLPERFIDVLKTNQDNNENF
jgi:hypothetical protein